MLFRKLLWIMLFVGILCGGLLWQPKMSLQSASLQQTMPPPPPPPPPLEGCTQYTIYSVQSGSWDAPNTWQPRRTPTEADVVAIGPGYVVELTSMTPRTVALKELCNAGTLHITAPELHFDISRVVVNAVSGVIETLTVSSAYGYQPSNLWLDVLADAGRLVNDGRIIASEEQANEQGSASAGGSITAGADWAFFGETSEIRAGNGGVGGVYGGDGGSIDIWARYGIFHSGSILAGNGGDCNVNPIVAAPQMGGRGGSVTINVSPPTGMIEFNDARVVAGRGGSCLGSIYGPSGSYNFTGSVVTIEPIQISISGAGNRLEGGNITIFTDEGGSIDLSGMDTATISATQNITLAVGAGGVITMTGEIEPVLQAAENVIIYADEVVTDPGVTPEELTDSETFQNETSTVLRIVDTWPGAAVFPAVFNQPQMSFFFLNNISPVTDTFQIEATTSSPHWSVTPVDTTLEMLPLELREFAISITPQMGAALQATLVVTVTSQSDPSISASATQELSTIYRSYAPFIWLAKYYRTYAPLIRMLQAASIILRN